MNQHNSVNTIIPLIYDLIDRLPTLPNHVRLSMKVIARRSMKNLSLTLGEMELMYRRGRDGDTELQILVPLGSPHPWDKGPYKAPEAAR